MIIYIHFEEYCCYNITETLHHARKKRVILGGERVLYTWPSLIAFSTNAWFRCCFRRPSALSSFPPCVSLSLWPSGFRIDFGWRCSKYLWFVCLFVWHWFDYLLYRLLPLGRLAFVLACHLGCWMPYLRGLKLGDITTFFVCARSWLTGMLFSLAGWLFDRYIWNDMYGRGNVSDCCMFLGFLLCNYSPCQATKHKIIAKPRCQASKLHLS